AAAHATLRRGRLGRSSFFAWSLGQRRQHPAEDLQPDLVELDHEPLVGAGQRALHHGALAERGVTDAVPTGEPLDRWRRRRGLDLALQVALLVSLSRRRDRRAALGRGQQRLGDVREEAAWERRLRTAVQVAAKRAAQVQTVLRARHSYIGEAALLGHPCRRAAGRRVLFPLVQRALVRQQALLHAYHEHDRELQALDHVQGDQSHALAVLVVGVDVGHKRDLGEEVLETLGGISVVELLGQSAQLIEVLDPSLALWRAVEVVAA